MQNPKIAPQLAPLNAEAPKFATAHVLPADIKISGKNIQDVKAEAQSAADEFAANLKEGLEKEAKKGENKADLAAAALAGQTKPVLLPDPKTSKNAAAVKEEKTELSAKTGVLPAFNPNAKPAFTDLKNAHEAQAKPKPELTEKEALAEKTAQAALADKTVPFSSLAGAQLSAQNTGKNEALEKETSKTASKPAAAKVSSLNSLQEMMLSQQVPPAQVKGAQAKAELAQALQASEGADPQFAHAFEIESLGLGAGVAQANHEKSFSELADASEKRAPSSKVSTSDFLSLRDLTKQNVVNGIGSSASSQNRFDLGTAVKAKEGKKDKLESLGGKEALAGGSFASRLDVQGHVKTMDAPVTSGSLGKTVITHDAIHEMTKQVNLLSQAKQDGEIKIRLRPDHLGELHMSVKTQGQQVSLEIKAQNNESKKIIEESLASLKDSLAGQSLTLSRVDVVSAPTHTQTAADQGTQFDMSQFRQNSGQQSSGREFEQSGRNESLYEEMSAPVNLSSVRRPNQSATSGRGLDLIA